MGEPLAFDDCLQDLVALLLGQIGLPRVDDLLRVEVPALDFFIQGAVDDTEILALENFLASSPNICSAIPKLLKIIYHSGNIFQAPTIFSWQDRGLTIGLFFNLVVISLELS